MRRHYSAAVRANPPEATAEAVAAMRDVGILQRTLVDELLEHVASGAAHESVCDAILERWHESLIHVCVVRGRSGEIQIALDPRQVAGAVSAGISRIVLERAPPVARPLPGGFGEMSGTIQHLKIRSSVEGVSVFMTLDVDPAFLPDPNELGQIVVVDAFGVKLERALSLEVAEVVGLEEFLRWTGSLPDESLGFVGESSHLGRPITWQLAPAEHAPGVWILQIGGRDDAGRERYMRWQVGASLGQAVALELGRVRGR